MHPRNLLHHRNDHSVIVDPAHDQSFKSAECKGTAGIVVFIVKSTIAVCYQQDNKRVGGGLAGET